MQPQIKGSLLQTTGYQAEVRVWGAQHETLIASQKCCKNNCLN